MKTNRNWYVVYTKQGNERKVADLLERRKLVTYCPTCTHAKDYNGKTKLISVSLFSTMVFVYVTQEELATVKNMESVSGILYWLQNPAIISASEIDAIRRFLNDNEDVQLEKNVVQSLKEGSIESVRQISKNDYKTFGIDNLKKLHLPSLGYTLFTSTSVARLRSVA